MSDADRKVAVITGGAQGIGAGLVAAYRARGWAVVANSLKIEPSKDPEVLTVAGDVSDPATAEWIADGAIERFGRIDTLVNNAGVFMSKPFTEYTAADYALVVGVNLAGFFWTTQRVIASSSRSESFSPGMSSVVISNQTCVSCLRYSSVSNTGPSLPVHRVL